MDVPDNKYDTYQDVRNHLRAWTLWLLCAVATGVTLAVLFLDDTTVQLLEKTTGGWAWEARVAAVIAVVAALTVVLGVVAHVLIEVLDIHDSIYDRVFIGWRARYTEDVILPQLIRSIRNKLPDDFLQVAARHKYEFMKPFYHFVGDRDTIIRRNTVVRFYEQVTKYWQTQLTEMFLSFLMLAISTTVILIHPVAPCRIVLDALIVLSLMWVVNRIFVHQTRAATKRATLDECNWPQKLDHVLR